jgi:thioredoxin reductase (NADPH)
LDIFVNSGKLGAESLHFYQDGEQITSRLSGGIKRSEIVRNLKNVFGNQLELDQWGYIKTDEDKRTNIDGVFAVGDVTSKKYRQITTAIADGTIAAIAITREIG